MVPINYQFPIFKVVKLETYLMSPKSIIFIETFFIIPG